jgi:hypothetical protein
MLKRYLMVQRCATLAVRFLRFSIIVHIFLLNIDKDHCPQNCVGVSQKYEGIAPILDSASYTLLDTPQ